VLEQEEPLSAEMEGWRCDISAAQSWEELPAQARRYLDMMEEAAGAPVEFISIGPDREQLIRRQGNG
jgi:adenylosuccinate synthase